MQPLKQIKKPLKNQLKSTKKFIYVPQKDGKFRMYEVDDPGKVSDGFHTFDELYDHRLGLFAALMLSNPEISWISPLHDDGSRIKGWFIAGMNLPTGPITYHLPNQYLEHLNAGKIKYLNRAPEFDGHTSQDVLQRLADWVDELNES